MKVRPTPKPGRVVVEVGRNDESLLSAGESARTSPFALDRILVPTDFSDCSKKALQYALPLARQFKARLMLVYVFPPSSYLGAEFGPVDYPVPERVWHDESLKQLDAWAQREIGGTTPWGVTVRQGQPAHEIAASARETAANLIVISTHGRTGLRHVLLGSVAENVVRYAPCPVLVVRQHEHEFLREATGSSPIP